MSTKTSIKRIAAAAAVALTLGGFSAVSAHAAAAATATLQATAGYSNASGPSASTAATANAVADGNHYVTVKLIANTADKGYTVSAVGVGSIYGSAAGTAVTDSYVTVTNNNGANAAGGFAFGPGQSFPSASAFTGASYVTFTVVSSAAGSQTITATPINGTSAASTLTITWGVAPTLSAANSKIAVLAWDTDAATTATAFSNYLKDATVVSTSAASATVPAAVVRVIVKNDESTPAAISGDTISASIISGPGLLTTTASAVADTYTVTAVQGTPSTVATRTTGTAGAAFFHVLPSGASGVTTIQFKDGTTVLGTATVTFYGTTPTKIVASQNYNIAAAGTLLGGADGTSAGSGAVTITATDTNAYAVGNLGTTVGTATGNWTAKSDNTSCVSSTIAAVSAGTSASGASGVGAYEVDVTAAAGAASGCVANVTFKYVVSSSVTLATDPVKFTVGGTTIYGIALTADQDTYAPGDKVKVTLTAKDVSGNLIADGNYGVFFDHTTQAAFAGLTTSAATTKAPFALAAVNSGANSITFLNGVSTSTIYAPYTDGTVAVSGTLAKAAVSNSDLATALKGTALTGSFTVVTGSSASAQAAIDAAQEATDAANAAYDAANNAMDSADAATAAAQDASDNASAALAAVTSLSATVAKLVASVSAITTALASIKKKLGVK